jgi:hypothetical protein
MDGLRKELAELTGGTNLSKAIENIDKILEDLERGREQIALGQYSLSGPTSSWSE